MPSTMKIVNEAAGSREAEILLYNSIGDDQFGDSISAKQFAESLKALGPLDKITCRVNCPGGSAWDGMAIFNVLKDHPAKVEMNIDGLAASAASFIVQAASPGMLKMADNAMMMIHCAASMTYGDSRDHAKTIEILDKLDETISGTYAKRSGRQPQTFLSMMKEETWFTAAEAKEAKLVDEVMPGKKVAACFGLKALAAYKHTPADIAERLGIIAKDDAQLRVGQAVVLKSSGPEMVVKAIDGETVVCEWLIDPETKGCEPFRAAMLDPAPPKSPPVTADESQTTIDTSVRLRLIELDEMELANR